VIADHGLCLSLETETSVWPGPMWIPKGDLKASGSRVSQIRCGLALETTRKESVFDQPE